jgi:predicted ester cyclase
MSCRLASTSTAERTNLFGAVRQVFSRFTWRGTHCGEFFGVPPTGRQISVNGMVVDRVVAGKMAESRILMDGLCMMRQLGVVPAQETIT